MRKHFVMLGTMLSLLGAIAMANASVAIAGPLPDPLPCTPCFIGKLSLIDNPDDPTGKTKKLTDDLYFIDQLAFAWKAGKGDITDGATIPELFQPIIGGPFEADFLPAAVIHDHYTNKAHRVRSWRGTARVFYQAMVVNGVNIIKAKTMYYAVYAFGPHWDVLDKGVVCGKNCVFSAPFQLEIMTDKSVRATTLVAQVPDNMQFAEEPSDFRNEHGDELRALENKIAANEIRGKPYSLEELEREAESKHSTNVFLALNRLR
jgi:hypothetical protein